MAKELEFVFDFASPNAYLVSKALPPLLERTGATLKYNLCLLGGIFKLASNQAPMIAFANIPNKMAYETLEFRRFIAKHKLDRFKMNPAFPVNTVMLMRGALVAEEEGYLDQYIAAGLKAMWEDGVNMSDAEAFVAALTEVGMDGRHIAERTQDPAIKTKLADNTTAIVERGAFGIPTFFAGEEMFFGKERLDQVEEALAG